MLPINPDETENTNYLRESTVIKSFSCLLAYSEGVEDISRHFQEPEHLFNSEPDYLKKGGSATVARIKIQGNDYVLKRYNIKNIWHRLRRLLRPTRAWHSWISGHRLMTLGVNTPKPVLVLERRCGMFRGTSYLLTEYCPGSNLMEVCDNATDESLKQVINQFDELLQVFKREKIAHGDFKASNFIWNGRLNLIDLDAIHWFKSERQWRNAYNADLDRLLRNWPEDSPAHRAFSVLLQKYM